MPEALNIGRPVRNRAAVLSAIEKVDIVNRPYPICGPDEVIIRVEAVGLCGSDVHYYKHGKIGSFALTGPLVLGHETAGSVVEVGENVGEIKPGMRVAVEPGVPCGRCDLCRQGKYNLCANVNFHATPPVDGTLQEYISARADFIFPLPDAVSTEEGALIEPLAVAVWAARKARIVPGMSVLITGAGTIGLLALQVAISSGASHIAVTDFDPDRIAMADSLGASESSIAMHTTGTPGDRLFDVFLECSGSPEAVTNGIGRLKPSGAAILVGMGASNPLDIPISTIQEKELWITGTFRYANSYPAAIELLRTKSVDVAPLITRRYSLNQTEEALISAYKHEGVKTIVCPNR